MASVNSFFINVPDWEIWEEFFAKVSPFILVEPYKEILEDGTAVTTVIDAIPEDTDKVRKILEEKNIPYTFVPI